MEDLNYYYANYSRFVYVLAFLYAPHADNL
jgi:hypothetical protein